MTNDNKTNVIAVWTASVDGLTAKELWNTTDGTLVDGAGNALTARPTKYRRLEVCNSSAALKLWYMPRKKVCTGATLRVSSSQHFTLNVDETRIFEDMGDDMALTFLNNGGGAGTANITVAAFG